MKAEMPENGSKALSPNPGPRYPGRTQPILLADIIHGVRRNGRGIPSAEIIHAVARSTQPQGEEESRLARLQTRNVFAFFSAGDAVVAGDAGRRVRNGREGV
jgi:hypothetical protein